MTPSGGKLWRWTYRFEGKQRLMTLGRYPEVSLADARERRLVERKVLSGGSDPMTLRKSGKQAEAIALQKAFSTMAKLWLSTGGKARASGMRRQRRGESL